MTTHIRPAVPDDARAIIAVRIASWRATYGGYLPESYWEAEYDPDAAAHRLAGSIEHAALRVLVACAADTIVGYTFYGAARDDDLPPGVREIYAIYVHPDAWSTGVGRDLMSAALADLGEGSVVLWVLTDNVRARRFYERAGFAADGTEKPAELSAGVTMPEVRYRIHNTASTARASCPGS